MQLRPAVTNLEQKIYAGHSRFSSAMPSILFAALTAWRLHIQAVQIAVSPLAHRVQNGDDALSKWGKRIYRLRRLFWNYFTMNHAVVFQIVKLLRKHLRRGVWNAYYFLGLTESAIAKSEGVSVASVSESIQRGLRNMETFLKNRL